MPEAKSASEVRKPSATYFLWSKPIMRRGIILRGHEEKVTDKGRITVMGSGLSVMVEYGVLRTTDAAIIDALKKHPMFGNENKGKGFRVAESGEATILDMLHERGIPQSELLTRMRAILRAQNPGAAMKEAEAF